MNTNTRYALYFLLSIYAAFCLASKFYIVVNTPLDSDTAQFALVVYDMLDNHNYLLENWYVNTNNYIFTDLPFHYFAGLVFGMTPLTVKMVAFLLLVSGIFLLSLTLLRAFGRKPAAAVALAMLSISFFSAQLWLKPTFRAGTILFSFLALLIVFIMPGRGGAGRQNKTIYPIFFIVTAMAAFSDPFYLFIFVAPLMASLLIWRLCGQRLLSGRGDLILSALMLCAAAAGILLPDVADMWGLHITKARTLFSPDSHTTSTVIFDSIIKLFDIGFWRGPVSAGAAARLANFVLLAGSAVIGILIVRKEKPGSIRKFAALFFLTLAALTIVSFLAKERFSDYAAPRHLLPLVYAYAVFLGLALGGEYFGSKVRALLLALLLISGAGSAVETYRHHPADSKAELAQFLEKENLTYGYSSYFNSHIVTLHSKNRVKTRPLFCFVERCRPFYWWSKSDWFRPSMYEGPTFLAVPKSEPVTAGDNYDMLYAMPELVENLFGTPSRVLRFNDMLIYEWPYNIVKKLVSVDISEKTPRILGSLEEDAGGVVISSKQGEQGALIYGNPWPLGYGKYVAVFDVMASGEPGSEAAVLEVQEIDVKAKAYTQNKYSETVTSSDKSEWKRYFLKFEKQRGVGDRAFEFRVLATGAGAVKVRSVMVEKL